jgi:hypothetical protein
MVATKQSCILLGRRLQPLEKRFLVTWLRLQNIFPWQASCCRSSVVALNVSLQLQLALMDCYHGSMRYSSCRLDSQKNRHLYPMELKSCAFVESHR